MSARPDGRAPDELRPVTVELGFQEWAEGSCLLSMGRTKVLVAASVQEDAPRWLRGSGTGWVTGEYAMLPRATAERTAREVQKGRPGGRTQEIQRLIGRSLRAVTDLRRLGERTVTIDCDVLVADAGTRCASITGGYVALALALRDLAERGLLFLLRVRDRYGVWWSTQSTVNVLEAVRATDTVRSLVVVTTDKCYENREQIWGYREPDRLGGADPYSASKAAAELAIHAYQRSFCSADPAVRAEWEAP